MDDGILWRIIGAACLLLLLKSWLDRPRPPDLPVTITMAEDAFTRDSASGTAYIEFRSAVKTQDGHSPECAATPTFVLQRRIAGVWFSRETVTRDCQPHQADPGLDGSHTWHVRAGAPGRYRVLLLYRVRWKQYWVRGPGFEVR